MRKLVWLLLLLFAVYPVVGERFVARAEEEQGSGVLEDLNKDASFDYSDYLYNDKDYSLNVIHIAESADGELLVYVYQPSGESANLRASSITISKGYKTLNFNNYKLKYVNSYGVLFKYKVEDFKIDGIGIRVYDVLTIYRKWDEALDKPTDNGNVINEVAYGVGKIYALKDTESGIKCEVKDTDTVKVISKYVGFVRYYDGFKLFGPTACDSHFVAFSTDKKIDKLLEADVYYVEQSCETIDDIINLIFGLNNKFGEKIERYSYVTDKHEIQYTTTGLFNAGQICRDRISNVEDFISAEDFENVFACGLFNVTTSNNINEEGKAYLRECEWVVRFAETEYSKINHGGVQAPVTTTERRTIVSDVSLLRLEFETDGKAYNLGVVDNKQTGSNNPVNDWKVDVKGLNAVAVVIAVCIVILAVVLIVLFIKTICRRKS